MSAAIVESYDAHMQDYSTENMQDWNDETMDDMSFQYDGDSIEVEMGFDQEDSATKEYEMVDSDHHHEYQPMEADIEEIQIYEPIPIESIASADMEHSYHDAMDHHPANPVEHYPIIEPISAPLDNNALPTELVPVVEEVGQSYEVVGVSHDHLEEPPHEDAAEASVPTEPVLEDTQGLIEVQETQVPYSNTDEREPHSEEDQVQPAEYVSEVQPHATENDRLAVTPTTEQEITEAATDLHEIHAEIDGAVEVSAEEQLDEPQTEYAETVELAQIGNIETAPCVSLSILPSDTAQFYLFDQPSPDLPGPSSVTTEVYPPNLTILLHEMPWLFSIGLGEVFKALRSEDAFTDLLDLEENELVLDAQDLRLTFSENRERLSEVTLRDLNDLHDSNGLIGPLRLQVQTAPNYLARFYHMKEKMNQLDLSSIHEVEAIAATQPDADEAEEVQEQEQECDQKETHRPSAEDQAQEHLSQTDIPEDATKEDSEEVPEEVAAPLEEKEDTEYNHNEENPANPAAEDNYEETNYGEDEATEEQFYEQSEDEDALEEQEAADSVVLEHTAGQDEDDYTADQDEAEQTTVNTQNTQAQGVVNDELEDHEEQGLKSFEEILNDDSAEHDEFTTLGDPTDALADGPSRTDDETVEFPSTDPSVRFTPVLANDTTFQDLDDDGLDGFDTTFELDAGTVSSASSSTLDSRVSAKRSFEDVFESDGEDGLEFLNESPNSKRARNE